MKKHSLQYEIYTDGSKTEEGVGFAAISKDFKCQYSLPSIATVFTAELCAIHKAVTLVQEENLENVTIYSDSKSAIEAIKSFNHNNPIAFKIRFLLHTGALHILE